MTEEKIIAVCFPRLYKTVRRFFSEVLGIVRKRVGKPETWPKAYFQHIEFRSPGSANIGWVEKQDISNVITQVWPEAAAAQSYRDACGDLEALQSRGKAVGHDISDLGAAYLAPLVRSYISRLDANFDESCFQKIYDDFETYLESEFVEARVFLQLQYLIGDTVTLELDGNHSIRKLDEDTARHIWFRAAMADVPGLPSFGRPRIIPMPEQFVLVGSFKFRKTDAGKISVLLHSEATRSGSAVRLVQPGSGPIKMIGYDYTGFFPENGRLGFREEYSRGKFSYSLNASVAEQMKRLWPDAFEVSKQLEKDPKKVATHIRIGITRYLGSFAERVAEDRLLDYIIALEALCGRGSDAVSYRIPLRIATLIGRNADEREKLFNLVAQGYDQRSKVSHGAASLTEPLDQPSERLILDLQATVLRTIHTNLRAEKKSLSKEKLIKLIDSAIRTQDRSVLESKIRPEFL